MKNFFQNLKTRAMEFYNEHKANIWMWIIAIIIGMLIQKFIIEG